MTSSQTFKRVKTPTVLQMENTECGAASLCILLQYHGLYVPLTQLRELCGVNRDGSDAANLIMAARSLGMDARGFKKGITRLKSLKPPAILFWDFNHFLVYEGHIGEKAALNDPALGPRIVSEEELDQGYTGIVLTMEPTAKFKRGGRPPTVWPVVMRRLFSEPGGVLFTLICGILLILPQLIMPIFGQIYLDEVIGNQMNQWLKPMLYAMALTIAFQALLRHLQLVGIRTMQRRLTRRFAVSFEEQILALPESFYAQRHAADIANRMASNQEIADFISERLIPTVTGLLLLIFYLILTFLYSPWLGLLILITTGINAIVVQVNLRMQKDANLRIEKDDAKASSVVVSAMRDIETVKAAAIEKDILRRYSGYQSRLLNTIQSLETRNAQIKIIPNAMTILNEVLILLIGFILVIKGQLTLGMLLAAQTIAFGLKDQIENVIGFIQELPAFSSGVIRLEDVIEQPRDPLLLKSASRSDFTDKTKKLSGKIEIDQACFGFAAINEPFIQNLTITIQPGQCIALVGGSGSGKSTIAKLIAGLNQPTSGKILFDNFELVDIPRAIATNSIAMVQQEIHLYGCSVKDNLTLWDSTINDQAIKRACLDAEIFDVLNRLPEGFTTCLSEGGNNLSGGQRQRVEIARALTINPSILILDEATSALDAETEHRVIKNLRRRGCTQIIVAHRLSTIRDADQILMIEEGRVIQNGTHDQLLQKQDSPYRQLLQATE
tara:strand:+ start:950 stop:3124 length:2175 start_codon:yes stop_codon:yes gene_type:complete